MPNGESEKLVEAVAERVRVALAEAERRAEEIVDEATRRAEELVSEGEARARQIEADADAKAAKTVALSEDQARERIERARKALDELGVALGSVPEPQGSDPPEPEPPVEPPEPQGSDPPEPVEPPEPQGSDPSPPDTPEPEEAQGSDPVEHEEPADKPSTEELIAQLKGAEATEKPTAGGDEAAARLVAMQMALDGASRDEVEVRMADEFGLADSGAMLDEVFERAGR